MRGRFKQRSALAKHKSRDAGSAPSLEGEGNTTRATRLSTAPRVALLIESSNAYARGLLSGIAEFVQAHGAWSIYFPEISRDDGSADRLHGWTGDGVIVRAESQATLRTLAHCRCPIVNVSAAGLLPKAPAFHSDVRAETEVAFEHLWERGFRHLGFCGVRDYCWSGWQQERFGELARAKGLEVSSHVVSLRGQQPREWTDDRRALTAWLRALPKPAGVFACFDLRGQQVLDACREAGIAVPEQVAVIGVDNDPVRCNLSDPPLSSVAPNARRIGYLAAEHLAAMMDGSPARRACIWFRRPASSRGHRRTRWLSTTPMSPPRCASCAPIRVGRPV
ncbi:MAG: XylR family transcriptional regulator [Tepidisphaeraceae bacterium]